MKKTVLVITGVPGTGKTLFSNQLKAKLRDVEVIHVAEVVNKKRLFSSHLGGSKVVRMQALRAELERLIKKSDKKVIILESHLLCDMKIKGASAIVLREHLPVLKKRLEKRGYGREKLDENIISEATDYCGIHAERNYDHVFESFSRNKSLVNNVLKIIAGRDPRKGRIRLLQELAFMIKRRQIVF